MTAAPGPDRARVTGLVLAGGRGSRMGGADKGLQLHHGAPLARHAAERLAPQVGSVVINANRHLDVYRALGWPVCTDALPDFAGPLAGVLAGLQACATPWLATVPCDSPSFPLDLVERLAGAIAATDARIAMAATRGADGTLRAEPVFCLMHASVLNGLERFVATGGRKVGEWADANGTVPVPFDDARAFANVNTLAELERLERLPPLANS